MSPDREGLREILRQNVDAAGCKKLALAKMDEMRALAETLERPAVLVAVIDRGTNRAVVEAGGPAEDMLSLLCTVHMQVTARIKAMREKRQEQEGGIQG